MEETKQQKLSQPFVPIPVSFLNEMIANENAPLSHRVLAVILRQMFDIRKKEQDKLTVSYIAKALHCNDWRHIKRAVETICKIYPFQIENNGQGNANKILLQTSAQNGRSKPLPKMAEEPLPKMAEEPLPKMADTIESRIDSIERKRIIEITGDEWC